jgi:hypothetical protein
MKIQPIKTVFSGELTELRIRTNGFDIESDPCTITCTFLNKNGNEIKTISYTLTDDEYENWGEENNYLFTVFKKHFKEENGVDIIPF